MAMISEAKRFMTDWIDVVSGAVEALISRFVRAQRFRLVEADDGTFTVTAAGQDRRALSALCLRLEGLSRRCRRSGRRRCGEAGSRCKCGRLTY
jgi:hypothetical protein